MLCRYLITYQVLIVMGISLFFFPFVKMSYFSYPKFGNKHRILLPSGRKKVSRKSHKQRELTVNKLTFALRAQKQTEKGETLEKRICSNINGTLPLYEEKAKGICQRNLS